MTPQVKPRASSPIPLQLKLLTAAAKLETDTFLNLDIFAICDILIRKIFNFFPLQRVELEIIRR